MKKVVIAWGRMNPVTVGHEKLVDKVNSVAKRERAEARIYLSHTQNAKKDPLQYKDKIAMAKKAFGGIVRQSPSRTLIQLMQELQRAGITDIVMVAGSDRVSEYKTLLNKYNGKEYEFNSIKVVSAGERDPDAEGAAGMSATKLRKVAVEGDFNEFKKGVPSKLTPRDVKKLYDMIRKGMLVEEFELFLEKKSKQVTDKDFSDKELDKAVTDFDEELDEDVEEELEEDDLIERKPLSIVQRMRRSRQMRRLAPKLKRQRQIKKFRMAPKERLEQRARKIARNLLRKKFAGEKGGRYSSLSPSEKITVDRLIATKSSIIDRLAKRLLPKVRKQEVERLRQARQSKNESIEYLEKSFKDLFEATKTRQDSDIKDREGTQPARYHKGLAPSTKAARDAHFKKGAKMDDDNPAAYKPAPGDKEADTKPSKWTKKYKDLFDEQPRNPAMDRAKKRIERERQADMRQDDAEERRERIRHDRLKDRARMRDAMRKNAKTRVEQVEEALDLSEKSMDALKKKAEKSGYTYGTLKKVYDRGVAAWRTGHRPGTTPQQWGYARVNAFIAKQKTGKKLNHDTDLANEELENYNQLIDEGVNDPSIFKAVFLAGGPGSGKSFIVGKTALTSLGMKVINSDDVFERALAKANLDPTPENIYSPAGQELRKGAKILTKKKLDLALAGRLGLVIDGTGKDFEKIMQQAIALRKLGYDTAMIFVNTDEETALKRNRMRPRTLPDDTVSKMWKDVQKNLGKFQVFFGSSMFIVDNSENSDVMSQTNNIYRKIAGWSRKIPNNSAVKSWIKSQKSVNESKIDELSLSAKDITKSGLNKVLTKDNDKLKKELERLRKGLKKEEAPVIDGKKMHRLGSKPGSYKALVKRHLGARAAEKIDKSDGNKLVAKGKRTGNQDLVRKGSFIKNVIAKEENQLDESLQIEKGAGIGTFLTAADLGIRIKAGYAHHPSVEEEHGAGEEGTDKLVKKYKKDTPEQ